MGWKSVGRESDGDDAILDERCAVWWLGAMRLLKLVRPDISVVVIQAKGRGSKSGGTHADGWALDLRTYHLSPEQRRYLIAFLRRFGGVAWYRSREQGFDPHIHVAVYTGGFYSACQYQGRAAHAGRNGLRGNGRDTEPAPDRWVSYAQGMVMIAAELVAREVVKAGVEMTKSEMQELAEIVATRVWTMTVAGKGSAESILVSAEERAGKAATEAASQADRVWQILPGAAGSSAERLVRLDEKLDHLTQRVGELAGGLAELAGRIGG